jgi:chemotaxis protein MotA
MLSLPIGLFGFFLIILLGNPRESWALYLNTHALMVVIGGTAAILAISTPTLVLKALWHGIVDMIRPQVSLQRHRQELLALSKNRTSVNRSQNALIQYTIELWQKGVSPEMFHVLLSQYREQLESTDIDAIYALRNLSKYPPALGMTGTVMGLVKLFSDLGGDNKANIGPALAIALTATFYGLIMANGLVMPLSDRLHVAHVRRKNAYAGLYEILLLINRQEPTLLIEAEIKARAAA